MSNTNLVSIAEITRLTGKDFKTIKKRIIGIDPAKKEGTSHFYDAKEILELLYTDKESEELDLTKERAKLAKVQRQKAEIELAEMTGEVMSIDSIVLYFQKVTLAVRARLLAMPVKLAPSLVNNIDDPREIQPILKEEVYAALNELASDKFAEGIRIDVNNILLKYNQINTKAQA